jgi:AbrB family looped-hinge helix DNA binding protein
MLTLPKVLNAKVKVSPKFQIVIPKAIREQLKIEPGQELVMYTYEGKLHIGLPRPITELRGIAKGMKWKDDYRDRNDRF